MMRMKIFAAIAVSAFVVSCDQDGPSQLKRLDDATIFMNLPSSAAARQSLPPRYTIFSAEYLTAEESGHVGREIIFSNVGNKQLNADFVPGISLDGSDAVSYYIDSKRPSGELTSEQTGQAITSAMTTWDGVSCSDLGLFQVPSSDRITTGFISKYFGFGGSYDYVADVVHAGWLGAAFFNRLAPQGSTYILAVTFTIIFTDDHGVPTDIDNNGNLDVAWREIYYNDAFPWAIGAHYDVETIALHEAGHGLSQGHFGAAFFDGGKGKLHFSPRAVMNAAYSGIQTAIAKTDNAGHCSNWSSWPNK